MASDIASETDTSPFSGSLTKSIHTNAITSIPVAMANSGPNTNSAQFFITYGPTPHLNDGFTIIGEVVSGKEIVDAITPRDPEMQPDFEGDTIISIVVTEK